MMDLLMMRFELGRGLFFDLFGLGENAIESPFKEILCGQKSSPINLYNVVKTISIILYFLGVSVDDSDHSSPRCGMLSSVAQVFTF